MNPNVLKIPTISFSPTFRSGISPALTGNHFNGFSYNAIPNHVVAITSKTIEMVVPIIKRT